MLTPEIGQKIMESSRILAKDMENNGSSVDYPVVHDVDATVSFQSEASDKEYLNYLLNISDQMQCYMTNISNSSTIADEYKRYLYHVLSTAYRFGKCIHYTKISELFSLIEAMIHKEAESMLIPQMASFFNIFDSTYITISITIIFT
jgi:hypothetical protein